MFGSTTLLIHVMHKMLPQEQQAEQMTKPLIELCGLDAETKFVDLTITMVDPLKEEQEILEGTPIVRVSFV